MIRTRARSIARTLRDLGGYMKHTLCYNALTEHPSLSHPEEPQLALCARESTPLHRLIHTQDGYYKWTCASYEGVARSDSDPRLVVNDELTS